MEQQLTDKEMTENWLKSNKIKQVVKQPKFEPIVPTYLAPLRHAAYDLNGNLIQSRAKHSPGSFDETRFDYIGSGQ